MQEVRDLTTVFADAMNFIRKAHADAKDSLAAEVAKARVNVDKINSMTREFKQANMELETFIGDTKSNFPPDSGTAEPSDTTSKANINGVTLYKEA